jgi:F0F1-type ATP synthase assembly protein I
MNEPVHDPKKIAMRSANMAAAGLAGQIGLVVPGIILVSVVVGLWLDKTFNTGKLITLIMVLGSLPASIYLTFRMAMRAVKEINQTMPPISSQKTNPSKEDETSD